LHALTLREPSDAIGSSIMSDLSMRVGIGLCWMAVAQSKPGGADAFAIKRYPNLFRETGHPQPGFVIALVAHLAGQAHASVYPGSW